MRYVWVKKHADSVFVMYTVNVIQVHRFLVMNPSIAQLHFKCILVAT